MLRFSLWPIAGLLMLVASCANEIESEPVAPVAADTTQTPKPVRKGTNAIEFPADGYTNHTPVTFIDYLKENVASGTVLLDKAPKGWIKKQHLKELINYIDSTEPCAGITLKGSGPNPPDNIQSCVGTEILLIIESYKLGVEYPAAPSSLTFIKILQKSFKDPSKLILIPQPNQLEAAKEYVKSL